MTHEEAISVLKVLASFQGVMEYLEQHSVSVQDACNMAIQALSQEPCRDIEEIAEVIKSDIDAETKCKMISNILTAKPHYFEKQEPCDDCIFKNEWNKIGKLLSNILEKHSQKSGHWIKAKPWMIDNTSYKWECSECEKSERFRHNYCPNCGAKMESEDKAE